MENINSILLQCGPNESTSTRYNAFKRLDQQPIEPVISRLAKILSETGHHLDIRVAAAKEITRQLTSPFRSVEARKQLEWLNVAQGVKASINETLFEALQNLQIADNFDLIEPLAKAISVLASIDNRAKWTNDLFTYLEGLSKPSTSVSALPTQPTKSAETAQSAIAAFKILEMIVVNPPIESIKMTGMFDLCCRVEVLNERDRSELYVAALMLFTRLIENAARTVSYDHFKPIISAVAAREVLVDSPEVCKSVLTLLTKLFGKFPANLGNIITDLNENFFFTQFEAISHDFDVISDTIKDFVEKYKNL